MKRKGQKNKGKLFEKETKELVADLKKQLGVEAVVFSFCHVGSVSIQSGEKEIAKTVLFSGEDIITNKKVAILIAEDTFLEGFQKKLLESIHPANKSVQ